MDRDGPNEAATLLESRLRSDPSHPRAFLEVKLGTPLLPPSLVSFAKRFPNDFLQPQNRELYLTHYEIKPLPIKQEIAGRESSTFFTVMAQQGHAGYLQSEEDAWGNPGMSLKMLELYNTPHNLAIYGKRLLQVREGKAEIILDIGGFGSPYAVKTMGWPAGPTAMVYVWRMEFLGPMQYQSLYSLSAGSLMQGGLLEANGLTTSYCNLPCLEDATPRFNHCQFDAMDMIETTTTGCITVALGYQEPYMDSENPIQPVGQVKLCHDGRVIVVEGRE